MDRPKPVPPNKWKPGQSGNPKGKPKGAISLASRIQKMLNDPEFTTTLVNSKGQKITFKGEPATAIIKTAILKAMSGDHKWAEWLAKNGYGVKINHEMQTSPIDAILEKYGLNPDDIEGEIEEDRKNRIEEQEEHNQILPEESTTESNAEDTEGIEQITEAEIIDSIETKMEPEIDRQTDTA